MALHCVACHAPYHAVRMPVSAGEARHAHDS